MFTFPQTDYSTAQKCSPQTHGLLLTTPHLPPTFHQKFLFMICRMTLMCLFLMICRITLTCVFLRGFYCRMIEQALRELRTFLAKYFTVCLDFSMEGGIPYNICSVNLWQAANEDFEKMTFFCIYQWNGKRWKKSRWKKF